LFLEIVRYGVELLRGVLFFGGHIEQRGVCNS
jgi:hypothetical protein